MTPSGAYPPVLVLGGDSAIALTIIRELGSHGVPVIVTDPSPFALARKSRYTTQFMQSPGNKASGNRVLHDAATLAQWLPTFIDESGAGAVIGISEGDLLQLAKLPAEIGQCKILTPRQPQLDTVLHKAQTLSIARSLGISVPESWHPQVGDDFAEHVRNLAYPVVLKWNNPPDIWPKLTQAGLTFFKADYARNADELLAILHRYDQIGEWPLVQSWCDGYGMGQMMLIERGQPVLRFQHRRLREYPLTGGVSTLCESVPLDQHKAQMEKSEALLRAIEWDGIAMVEYRYDPASNRYWLMEINGRFWGSMPLTRQCGVNFAWEQYRRAILGQTDITQPDYPVSRARFMVPDTKRLTDAWFKPLPPALQEKIHLNRMSETGHWLSDFFRHDTHYYIWDRQDPRPFVSDLFTMLKHSRHHK